MANVEVSDEDLAMLERLLASLSLNVGNAELHGQPAEMLLTYVATFLYGTVSGGRAPDGRPVLQALHEDVKHLHAVLGKQS